MIFLPHTNTVILLEPYCGTIKEPGLPVDSLLVKLSHILGVDSFAANAFSLWNFSYRFSALKQWQIPKGKYDFHVRMLHMNLKILSVFTFLYIS